MDIESRRLAQAHSLRTSTESTIRAALQQLSVRKAEAIRRWRVEAQSEVELIKRIEREARPLARQLRDMATDADTLPIQLAAAGSPVAPAGTCSLRSRRSPTQGAGLLPCPLSDSYSARGCRPPLDFLIRRRRYAELRCELSPADTGLFVDNSRAATPAAQPAAVAAAAAERAARLFWDAEQRLAALEASIHRAEVELALAAQAADAHARSQARRLGELHDACDAQAVLEKLLAEARRRVASATSPQQPRCVPGAAYALPQPYVSSPWAGGAYLSARAVLISPLGGRNAVTGRTTCRSRRAVRSASLAQISTRQQGAKLSRIQICTDERESLSGSSGRGGGASVRPVPPFC
jgi:hypothetical protein